MAIKRDNKIDLAEHILQTTGVKVYEDSLFYVQINRFHEYKRQHLNVLHIITRYLRLKKNPSAPVVPRTFIFAGKAAPGYFLAKLMIKLINDVAEVINHDAEVGGRYRVVFLPNYRVSLAEKILPAADLSEQISTAGMEASGTSNMKFALNGALTMGTLDGANVEIREAVGEENFFLFGMRADEVAELKRSGYDPLEPVYRNAELREVLDFIASRCTDCRPLLDSLPQRDPFLVLRDFEDYMRCQDELDRIYQDRPEWARRSGCNLGHDGRFSSDRAVREYAEDIWKVRSVPVTLPAD